MKIFLNMMVMWLAGNRLQRVCTGLENCEMGMYAPITNPEAAESIPKKAPLALVVLKNSTSIMKMAVADTEPRATTIYALKMSVPVRKRFPCRLIMKSPAVRMIPVKMMEDNAAAVKYAKMICHLLTGVARIS